MRESIVAELASVLAAAPEIKTVLRQFKQLDSISSAQFPCVMVEEDLPEVGFAWKSGGFADVQFQLSIIVAVKSRTAISSALTALDVVVKKTVAMNPTLNGTCIKIRLEPEVNRLGTEFAPYGMVVRPVTITYEGSAANGY